MSGIMTSLRLLRLPLLALLWLVGAIALLWALAALRFDFSAIAAWAGPLLVLLVAAGVWFSRSRWWAVLVPFAGFALVLVPWMQLPPSLDRAWKLEVSRLPWAEIDGDVITIHEVRDFDYPAGGEPVARWTSRAVRLQDLTGIDIAVNYWGSPWIAHPIIIFRFGQAEPLAFSIETRMEKGEEYSALAGFFRQYELIVLAGTERDLLGSRACHRQGEDVYLYATTIAPIAARERFLEYLVTMNALRDQPRWYNAVTSNCTTAIRGMNSGQRMPFDWRLLINGKGDEMLYERGALRTDGLPFAELKKRAYASPAARGAYAAGDFSAAIRRDRPGFGPTADR